MCKVFSFLTGLLLGALVGAVIVMLVAPQSGDKTQAALRARLNAIIEEGKRAAAERRAELETQFAAAKRAPNAN
jgi:gas vesicle protein